MRVLFAFLFLSGLFRAQIINKTDGNIIKDTVVVSSGEKDSMKIFRPTIYDYQHFTERGQRQIFDTVFSREKAYVFTQYNNQDNFGRIAFANVGEGFQQLLFEIDPKQNLTLLPEKKRFFIYGADEIRYYDVKTPTTSFVYHNTAGSGAALQSTYTQNFGKHLNISAEYMGLRSKGIYRRNLAAINTTTFTGHYLKGRYEAFAHFTHQNANHEENGGVRNLEDFLGGDSRFRNRANLEVNLLSADSRFAYRRYYLSHYYTPFDSARLPLRFNHVLSHQGNRYHHNQLSDENYFADLTLPEGRALQSMKYSKNLSNTFSALLTTPKFTLEAGARHQLIKLGVKDPIYPEGEEIPLEESENRLGAVGRLGIQLLDGTLGLNSFFEYSYGNLFNSYLRSANELGFTLLKDYRIAGTVNFQSAAPTFNYLLNSSFYQELNYRFAGYKNQNVLELGAKTSLPWFDTQLFVKQFRIDHFSYFTPDAQPAQSENGVNISQLGGEAIFKWKDFNLHSRLAYQKVLTEAQLLPLPELFARLNFYYQSKAFKNAAEIQTGLKVYYFSKFYSRNYFPVLNEFILPTADTAIGGQPIADAYFNIKVKRMFIFVEGQHFNTTFMQNKSFAAPGYPTSDFRLNLGIVWYLFH